MIDGVDIQLGVKTDPIEYRYSWEWLFRLMADEGVHFAQIGTFFEIYQLPDSALLKLRDCAERHGVRIASIFTAHRELGGFFRGDLEWAAVAFRNYQRLIRVGSLLGAHSVGSNPGAVMRDQMETKRAGIRTYVDSMKRLMHYAAQHGIGTLAIEPMSCLAEPPTLPGEVVDIAEELMAYHASNPNDTSRIGYCFDISHGYVDETRTMKHKNFDLLDVALPYITEVHLKNTDRFLESTFGFSAEERERGVINVKQVKEYLLANASRLPVREIVGYLELGGPKLGRDYSDSKLEYQLRSSLRYLKEEFIVSRAMDLAPDREKEPASVEPPCEVVTKNDPAVKIAPSMMCADMGNLRDEIQWLESLGVDLLHWDIMDAHFVPNMPCGLALLEKMRSITDLPFDVHLMVEDNDFFIAELSKIGVQMISVHYESAMHVDRTLSLIREKGAAAGIALNPATAPSVLEYLTHLIDFLLVMTVNPGFSGQKLTGSALAKIADCRDWLRSKGLTAPIEVDGNVSFDHIPNMVAAGADILVAGTSSIFHPGNSRPENMRKIRTAIRKSQDVREPWLFNAAERGTANS